VKMLRMSASYRQRANQRKARVLLVRFGMLICCTFSRRCLSPIAELYA
jgi:hypothetical protein